MLGCNPPDLTHCYESNYLEEEIWLRCPAPLGGHGRGAQIQHCNSVFALSNALGIGFDTVGLMWGAFTRTYGPRTKITHPRA